MNWVEIATIASPIIAAAAILVALWAMCSSSKDAQKQIEATKKLCLAQIDSTIEMLQLELDRIKGTNKELRIEINHQQDRNNDRFRGFIPTRDLIGTVRKDIPLLWEKIEYNDQLVEQLNKRIKQLKENRKAFE